VKVSVIGEFAEVEPVREIDVRGLRVDEVDDRVVQALDAAVRNDLRELRIIHGKGTGALRARVGEMLKKDTRVVGVRLGAWNEGGAGVTVAELA
jgi:DNA mismatch repair protein MutS2